MVIQFDGFISTFTGMSTLVNNNDDDDGDDDDDDDDDDNHSALHKRTYKNICKFHHKIQL